MNRIVLIGNGFDLAHGLKTRYEDFLNWYWEEKGKHLSQEKSNAVTDILCSFVLNKNLIPQSWEQIFGKYFVSWIHCDISFPIKRKYHDFSVPVHTRLCR